MNEILTMGVSAPVEIVERVERAREALRACRLCPRACGIDRTAGETGFCGLTQAARCFREVLHYGEEAMITPTHQIFLSGCNLRCEFCAVGEWNAAPNAAPELDIPRMQQCILQRRRQGARTLNFLGGEPTVSLFGVLQLLDGIVDDVMVLWNSNMYFSGVAAQLLDGVVDIYLADLKCGNAACAKQLLGADDYLKIVRENLGFARATAGLIVRHLVLPGHRECCLMPILEWIKENMPEVKLSLRRDYLPPAQADYAPLGLLCEKEYAEALESAGALGLNVIE